MANSLTDLVGSSVQDGCTLRIQAPFSPRTSQVAPWEMQAALSIVSIDAFQLPAMLNCFRG